MKVAFVSFGHSETAFPLVRALSAKIEIDLFLCLALNWRTQGLIDCGDYPVSPGLNDKESSEEIFEDALLGYIDSRFSVRLFMYHNLKLRSWRNWALSVRFARHLRAYDVIHFNGQNGVIPQLLFALLGKPKVFTIHDFESHTGEGGKRFPDLLNQYLVRSESQVVLQNRPDYDSVLRHYPDRKSTLNFIPFGVLDAISLSGSGNGHKKFPSDILFWGRISQYKGIDDLVQACRVVNESFPTLKVIIAGSGNGFDFSGIEGDEPFQIMNRHLTNPEIADLISQTKIVVCPYIDATQSGVVMTTFAFNKPVVATDVGGLAEVVEDDITGKVVPPCNPERLSEVIIDLLGNAEKLEKMRCNISQKFAKGSYSWHRIADDYIELYKKTVRLK